MSELTTVLEEWGMPHIFEVLKDQGIWSTEAFNYITEDDINLIFMANDLQTKMKFRFKVKEWRRVHGVEDDSNRLGRIEGLLLEVRDLLRPSSSTSSELNNDQETDYSLDTYLSTKSSIALNALVCQNNTSLLSNKGRSLVISNAVEYFLDREKLMQEIDFLKIGQQICARFSDEALDTYYYKNGNRTGGKLFHCYKNSLCRLRKEGITKLSRKRKLKDDQESVTDESNSVIKFDNEDKEWLKEYSEPYDELLTRWGHTFEQRKFEISETNFANKADIIEEWPLLIKGFGKDLINYDFERLGYAKCLALFEKWDHFCELFTQKGNQFIKDKLSLQRLNEMKSITNKEFRDATVFDLLSATFPPTVNLKHIKMTKIWRCSILDSQQHFILRVNSTNDLQDQLDQMAENLNSHNVALQPLVVLIGKDDEDIKIFGIYEKIKYEYTSILEAVSNIFKLHFVLNLPYQKPSHMVWDFIETYFFEINDRKPSPRVISFATELR